MKNKSDVLACFRDFHKGVQTQYGVILKVLRSDNETPTEQNGVFDKLNMGSICHLREFSIKPLAHTYQSRMG
jgi:hypothetical protein